jgi:hypothetical protein
MASFDWREVDEIDPFERFGPEVTGVELWLALLEAIWGLRERWGAAVDYREEPLFDFRELELPAGERRLDVREEVRGHYTVFLERTARLGPAPRACRVFVSHQRRDASLAERIAYLATRRGFEYWLDVHDPTLRFVNAVPMPAYVRAVLIAGIIEIALINCSHVCSVQTWRARPSRWVPYEFGRVKQRSLLSTQAASWFEGGAFADRPEYLLLGTCLLSEAAVERWLTAERQRVPGASVSGTWPRGRAVPPELPN